MFIVLQGRATLPVEASTSLHDLYLLPLNKPASRCSRLAVDFYAVRSQDPPLLRRPEGTASFPVTDAPAVPPDGAEPLLPPVFRA